MIKLTTFLVETKRRLVKASEHWKKGQHDECMKEIEAINRISSDCLDWWKRSHIFETHCSCGYISMGSQSRFFEVCLKCGSNEVDIIRNGVLISSSRNL